MSFIDSDGTTRFSGALEVSGGGVCTTIGPVTLTAADFAANWDGGNNEGGATVAELLAGDLVWGYRLVVTEEIASGGGPGTFVVLGVVDAGPGSWATPFVTTPTNQLGNSGPSFVTANPWGANDTGGVMTSNDTLFLVYSDGGGAPIAGSVTVWVFVVRP